MIGRYGLQADEPTVELPADVVEGFIDFGFEECFDSFGAFGLFQLAREHALFPAPLFDVFEHVIEEEARHIVFFINWFAHRQLNQGQAARVLRQPKALGTTGKRSASSSVWCGTTTGRKARTSSSRGRNPSSMTSRQCSCCRVAWRRTSAAWRASIDACSCRVSGRPSRESPWACSNAFRSAGSARDGPTGYRAIT